MNPKQPQSRSKAHVGRPGTHKLSEAADILASATVLRERLAAADRGEPGVPANRVLAKVRKTLGIQDAD